MVIRLLCLLLLLLSLTIALKRLPYSSRRFLCMNDVDILYPSSSLSSSSSSSSSYTYAVLVDIGVRELQDVKDIQLNQNMESLTPLSEFKSMHWPTFLKKLSHSSFDITSDKFLSSFDVGSDDVIKVSLSRIPQLKYQKLELGKRIADDVKTDSTLVVIMITKYGELIIDHAMAESIVSAVQSSVFEKSKMPSFKTSSLSLSSSINDVYSSISRSLSDKEKGKVFFTYSDDNSSNEDSSKDNSISSSSSSSSSNDSNTDDDAKQKKISSLAEMMMRESRRLYDDNSNTNKNHDNNAKKDNDLQGLLKRCVSINDGTNLARALASLPPNILNPNSYSDIITNISITHGFEMSTWNATELSNMGAGAYKAVIQANANSNINDRLIRLRYEPITDNDNSNSKEIYFPQTSVTIGSIYNKDITNNDNTKANSDTSNWGKPAPPSIDRKRPIVLVGKGVTYDTGGLNIKTGNSMKTMKHDMAGSAAALGLMLALVKCSCPYPVECWLALAENNIGIDAYRPDDVIRSLSGTTIEIVNTDAEGRLLLADTLTLATRKINVPSVHHGLADSMSPKLVLDFATLTGTCITSLSNRYIGAFTNRPDFMSTIVSTNEISGERIWPFPLDDDYDDDLKSDIADILQCKISTEADHIYAAAFLKKFVNPNAPWIHLDLGSAYKPGGLGHVSSDYTGSGVRAGFALIQELC